MLVTVDDWEAAARERLTTMAYDYFRSGADEEHTLRRNRDAFAKWAIWYRALVDVASPSIATTVLGEPIVSPIAIAPTANHKLAHADGERATSRAAAAASALYCVSTLATTSLEDTAAAAPGAPRWFQLYVHKDRDFTKSLIERAKAAGYRAIAVTADTPVLGRRCADVRNAFALPEGMEMENLVEALPADLRGTPGGPRKNGSELARFVASRHDAAFTWKDVRTIADACAPMPLVVKGIVRADDARRAIDGGAKAVWVSNHGGRQLDFAPATIDALPDVVRAVASDGEVFFDGGVRSGTHALVALALGARAVFVGRPILWGLSVRGAEGVERVLALLNEELIRSMRLAGCPDLASLRDDIVRRT